MPQDAWGTLRQDGAAVAAAGSASRVAVVERDGGAGRQREATAVRSCGDSVASTQEDATASLAATATQLDDEVHGGEAEAPATAAAETDIDLSSTLMWGPSAERSSSPEVSEGTGEAQLQPQPLAQLPLAEAQQCAVQDEASPQPGATPPSPCPGGSVAPPQPSPAAPETAPGDGVEAAETPLRRASREGAVQPALSSEKGRRRPAEIPGEEPAAPPPAKPRAGKAAACDGVDIGVGSSVAVFGDGWGSGTGGYEAIVTEAGDKTLSLVRVTGEDCWREATVLRDYCVRLSCSPLDKRSEEQGHSKKRRPGEAWPAGGQVGAKRPRRGASGAPTKGR